MILLLITPKVSLLRPENIFNAMLSTVYEQTEINWHSIVSESRIHEKVTVKQDQKKEFIEIDLSKLETDKLYIVDYQNTPYAVKKISDHEIVFYDVI